VDADPDFQRLAPTPLSTICFRARPRDLAERLERAGEDTALRIDTYLDLLNERVIDAVNATGLAFLSHTRLNGRYTIRIAIGNLRTDEAVVMSTWERIREEALRLDAERRPSSL
jgi:aromatic-L-amino-acid decarboxylase